MKFVGDRISRPSATEDQGYLLQVPVYHRASIGAFEGTILFAVANRASDEVIISSIDPMLWGDLWRIEATLRDEPGAALSLVDLLVEKNINILVQEGVSECSPEGEPVHQVLMIVDLSHYRDKIDGSTDTRNSVTRPLFKPLNLIDELLAACRDYLIPSPGNRRWQLNVSRMEFLFRHKDLRNDAHELRLDVEKTVELPGSMMRPLAPSAPNDVLPCHLTSDTEEKYLKLRVLRSDRLSLLLRAHHKEKVGAIQQCMTVLKDSGANILDAYSRLTSIHREAMWYSLVEMPPRTTKAAISDMLSHLKELEAIESVEVLDSHGSGPKIASRRSRSQTAQTTDTHVAIPIPDSTTNRLGIPYFNRASASDWKYNPRSAFLAMPFSEYYTKFFDQVLAPVISESGVRPIRVDRSPRKTPRERLPDRIDRLVAECRFVVADFSDWNANVIYEVGLADAISKPVIRLCEDRFFEQPPFDLRSDQFIVYSPRDPDSLTAKLRAEVEQVIEMTDE